MTAVAKTYANLQDFTTEDLKAELARALEITADNLVWLARLWRELEYRGEDLRELRTGLRAFLPLIADGRLDAQAAVQFAGNLTMLRALATLPIKEQRRLADGGRVTVIVSRNSELVAKPMRADDLSAKMIRQVFASGRIRSESEQRALVEASGPISGEKPRPRSRIEVDASKLSIWRRLAARRDMTLQQLIEFAMDKVIADEQSARQRDAS